MMWRSLAWAVSPCLLLRWRSISALGFCRNASGAQNCKKTALSARRTLEAELKTAGIHVVNVQNQGAEGAATRGSVTEALAELLSADDCAQVYAAIDGLVESGKALSLRCAGRLDGEAYAVNGFVAGACDITLILRNCSEEHARSAELSAEIDHLRLLLDAIEMPIWQRAANLDLSWCNKSYARDVDSSPRRVQTEHGPELISGVTQDEARALAQAAVEGRTLKRARHHVVVGGERRYLDIVESPLGASGSHGGGTAGWAHDISDLEQAEADLKRHIEAHAEVLQSLNTSIAVYAADRRLIFFNNEFVKMFDLEEGWLSGEPTLSEVLEALRERRRLPEQADWRLYKKRMNDLFTSVTEPEEELLHLPDGSTLRYVVLPHPFGGLQFMSQDVTDRYTLERAYSTLTAVQRATLDNLFEAVAVLGADGRLKLSNPGFATLWELNQEQLAGEPHIAEITELSRKLIDDGEDWENYKADHIARISERARSTMRLERRDEKVLDCTMCRCLTALR